MLTSRHAPRQTTWTTVVDPEVADRAWAAARDVGMALQDADRDGEQLEPGLARGHAGLALLASYLDTCAPGEGWDRIGHRHLAGAIADAGAIAQIDASLHHGWGGLVFGAAALAGGRPRYRTFLEQADGALAAGATALSREVERTPAPLAPPAVDLIGGLAGLAAVLLTRRERPECAAALLEVLHALAGLAATVDGLPRMASPGDWGSQLVDGRAVLNLGLAHGLPGPIAALALAAIDGVAVDGAGDALTTLVTRLRRSRSGDEWGPSWPLGIGLDPGAPEPRPARMGWCYGTPGCARALWLAGVALDQPEWRSEAIEAIRGAFRRPYERRGIASPTFCHGQAGLVHIGLRFAVDTGDDELAAVVRCEVERLVAWRSPGSRFGYRQTDRDGGDPDRPGLLDGAAGVALVLAAAATRVEPTWDRALLLS
jgi:hypothetical protein